MWEQQRVLRQMDDAAVVDGRPVPGVQIEDEDGHDQGDQGEQCGDARRGEPRGVPALRVGDLPLPVRGSLSREPQATADDEDDEAGGSGYTMTKDELYKLKVRVMPQL